MEKYTFAGGPSGRIKKFLAEYRKTIICQLTSWHFRRIEKLSDFPISDTLVHPLSQMPFKGLFIGSSQSIQKRCYNSTTVEQLGFLHISVVYRYIEYAC